MIYSINFIDWLSGLVRLVFRNFHKHPSISHLTSQLSAELSTAEVRDQVRDHDVAMPALLCHKVPAQWEVLIAFRWFFMS